MRLTFFIAGPLMAIAVVLLWPPAAVHIINDPSGRTIHASMSDSRTLILVIAIVVLIAVVAYAARTTLRQRAS